jgi:hypothetical protein
LPLNAVDAINVAFEHTRKQLFRPFRIGQWARLALVGLLAGELGSGSSCNTGSFPGSGPESGGPFSSLNPATLALVIAFLVVLGIAVTLVFIYLNSMMRFVLFDSIVARECHIRRYWGRRRRPGFRFFVWQILFGLAMGAGLIILVGIPAAVAFSLGWLKDPKAHVLPLVLGGILLFLVVFAFLLCMLAAAVLTKDFVVPMMALEDISALEGWRRLLAMLQSETAGYAGYIGIKIVLAIAAGIIFFVINLLVFAVLVLPVVLLGIAGVLVGKTAGLEWNVYTITVAVVFGSIFLAIALYIMSLVYVPAIVFFPAYGIHFFASRYPLLDAVLHPLPPTPPMPPPELSPAG